MDILMPQLGETVTEGKITKWFKTAGEAVKPGENLFEIETDKTSMEVPATSAGVLSEIRVPEGEIAPVGAVVAIVSGDGASAAPAPSAPASAKPAPSAAKSPGAGNGAAAPAPTVTYASSSQGPLDPWNAVRTPDRNYGAARLPGGTFVTPLARRLAAQSGIELGSISPSGPGGRIVAQDVESAMAKAGKTLPQAGGIAMARGASADTVKVQFEPGSYEEIPLDGMRRTIAARLTESKQTVPHFYLTADIELTRINAVRAEVNATLGDSGVKLSINDFVIKALAMALQRVPAANAVWAEDRILRFRGSDIGVAVSIDGGLVTPVIRGAQGKSVGTISAEMKDIAGRARAKKLHPQEMQGGSSAISNLGMYGVREFSAIINPPHATILAVGAARRAPAEAEDGSVKFTDQMTVTLSCDHRVVDGALGAQLLAAVKLFIEHPVGMMV
jgi:pyruvate dehydrogenase E2 component (dihydrolipoamide acetyltransferase)